MAPVLALRQLQISWRVVEEVHPDDCVKEQPVDRSTSFRFAGRLGKAGTVRLQTVGLLVPPHGVLLGQ